MFSNTPRGAPRGKRRSGFRTILIATSCAVLLVGLLGASFLLGVLAFPGFKVAFNPVVITTAISWQDKAAVVAAVSRAMRQAPGHYLESLWASTEIPNIRIDIKHKHIEKIRAKRDAALAKGYLENSSADFVPAQLRYKDRTVAIKLRLKGDETDHLQSNRWSMRIHVRKSDSVFGLRRFSIQAPKTRRYHREALILDHLRREGILAPRYFFAKVVVNGNDFGLMAIEENFSKELLEHSNRREGVIVKFNDRNLWPFYKRYGTRGPYNDFAGAEIDAFQSGKVRRSKLLNEQYGVAVGLLRGFLENRLTVSEVFDVELLARFYVILKIWSGEHAAVMQNVRYYLNPLTMHLEPIGYDAQPLLYFSPPRPSPPPFALMYKKIFSDRDFQKAYFAAARRIGRETAGPELSAWLRERERGYLRILYRENPLLPGDLISAVSDQARVVAAFSENMLGQSETDEETLAIVDADFPQIVNGFIVRRGKGYALQLQNILPIGVSVLDVVAERDSRLRPGELFQGAAPAFPIALAARRSGDVGRVVTLPLAAHNGNPPAKLTIVARVDGRAATYKVRARPYATALERNPIPTGTKSGVMASFGFLKWDPKRESFVADPGIWRVTRNLVLPPGAGLVLSAGTTLEFEPEAMIIARGPLQFSGTRAAPVILKAASGDSGWGGIQVLGSERPSTLEHVVIDGVSGFRIEGWSPTGGVTFRRAPVTIRHTVIAHARTEDALNIVRSAFTLVGVTVRNARSDGIDVDFSDGSVTGGRFIDIGGDGLDFSGSRVRVADTKFENVRDKAISVGEGSRLNATGVAVTDAGTGIASKDSSVAEIDGARLSRIGQAALMSYRKKNEFGPARLNASGVVITDSRVEAVAQTGSRLLLNGREITPREVDIDALYSTGNMRK